MKPTLRDGRLVGVLQRLEPFVDALSPLQLRIYRHRVAGREPEQIAEIVGRSTRKVSIILARARAALELAEARSVTAAARRA